MITFYGSRKSRHQSNRELCPGAVRVHAAALLRDLSRTTRLEVSRAMAEELAIGLPKERTPIFLRDQVASPPALLDGNILGNM